MQLLIKAFTKAFLGLLLCSLLLFVPAGTFYYPQAYLFLGILFLPMFFVGLILYFKNPELLRKRLNSKEEQKGEKAIIALSSLLFISVFILAGLDYRFSWSKLPFFVSFIASLFFLAGYLVYIEVIRENNYLSRTIEIQENQRVIDTGLYGIIRHPMYFSTFLLFLSMPLILGSLYGFLLLLFTYPPLIAWRMKDEEKLLTEELKGYAEYRQKVKYKIIPFIW